MYVSPIKGIQNIFLDTSLVPKPKELPVSKMHEFFSESLPLMIEQQAVSSKMAAKEADADSVGKFVGQIFNYFG